jgi:hypothetical protein
LIKLSDNHLRIPLQGENVMSNSGFQFRAASHIGPASRLVAVEPSDDTDLPDGIARSLFVGTAGDIELIDASGGQVRLSSGSSQYHPVRVRRILATGTTASGIIALY